MNYKKLSIYTIIIFQFSCTNVDQSDVIIRGSITNQIGNDVSFITDDTTYNTTVDETGAFMITFHLDSAVYIRFQHGLESSYMYVKPKDRIALNIDTQEFDETLKYKNSPESSFLAEKLLIREKMDFLGESLYLMNEPEYQSYLDEYKVKLIQKLDTSNDKNFKNTEIEKLNSLIDRYLKEKQKFSEKSKDELTYMWNAVLISREYNFYSLIESSNKTEFTEILNEYKNRMLESLIPLKGIDWYNKEEKDKIYSLIDKWKERKFNFDNMPDPGEQGIDFNYPDKNGETYSLSSFGGNLIYVDVWASWCGPCIAQIPALQDLEKDYHDKNITFLSISVDTDKDSWLKMLSDKNLGGVQLWADGWSDITKSYAIFGIPRFLLFDQGGKIISTDAPRPTSPEIRQMIDSNL